jgi:hypothetical protein
MRALLYCGTPAVVAAAAHGRQTPLPPAAAPAAPPRLFARACCLAGGRRRRRHHARNTPIATIATTTTGLAGRACRVQHPAPSTPCSSRRRPPLGPPAPSRRRPPLVVTRSECRVCNGSPAAHDVHGLGGRSRSKRPSLSPSFCTIGSPLGSPLPQKRGKTLASETTVTSLVCAHTQG